MNQMHPKYRTNDKPINGEIFKEVYSKKTNATDSQSAYPLFLTPPSPPLGTPSTYLKRLPGGPHFIWFEFELFTLEIIREPMIWKLNDFGDDLLRRCFLRPVKTNGAK